MSLGLSISKPMMVIVNEMIMMAENKAMAKSIFRHAAPHARIYLSPATGFSIMMSTQVDMVMAMDIAVT